MRKAKGKFTHLTQTARVQIEAWLKTKTPIKEIAAMLGVHISTIYREIKRGTYQKKVGYYDGYRYERLYKFKETYSPDIAEQKYRDNLAAKGAPLKIGNDFSLANYIEKKIVDEDYSPDAVLGEIRRNHIPFKTSICTTTLYSYIDKGVFGRLSLQHLANKGQKKKRKQREVTTTRAPRGISIEQRPLVILQRKVFGHWEMDCVCGSTKCVLLVLTERMTRKEIIVKMKDQTTASVIGALNMLERRYGRMFKRIFKTITVDNGSEFSAHEEMKKSIYGRGKSSRTVFYYCHPYCSSERGSNERMNREIRRKIPKGSNIAKYSPEEIKEIEQWLNSYPRRILGYASSEELFEKELAKIS